MSAGGSPDGKDPYCEAYKKVFAAIQEHVRTRGKGWRGWSAPEAPRPKSLVWGWPEPGAVVFASFQCTNNCIFCAPAHDRGKNPENLDRDIYEFISRCAQSGVRSLFFTGAGEPTLNPSLVDYVRHAKLSGIDHLFMFTNGFGVTQSLIKRLKEAGMENFWVSIHGLGETHDEIVRRRGSFVEAYRALSLINAVAPERLNVNTCLNALNIDQIELLMDKVLGFSHTTAHCLCLPEWDGNAYLNRDRMCRLEALKNRLSRISVEDYPITILDNVP
jgi:MoaA/NifB/PqqE/SkfB family radical SAM enzyme